MDCTTEQFKAFILEKAKQSREIPEEELDAIAGGNRTQDEPLHKFVIKLPSVMIDSSKKIFYLERKNHYEDNRTVFKRGHCKQGACR